jgi:dihydroorotate dehydrogenase
VVITAPWLWLPAQIAHDISPSLLRWAGPLLRGGPSRWSPTEFLHLKFPNPLGVAGGVDKNAENVTAWGRLGAGFIEVGTVTPRPQKANLGPLLDRDVPRLAVWNRLGFPSQGLDQVARNLERTYPRRLCPIFVNVGKNRDTPLEEAYSDYVQCFHRLVPWADAFVVNISSPNTARLRELLTPAHFRPFMEKIMNSLELARQTYRLENGPVLLLKLSPDLDAATLEYILDVSCELGVHGWIVANTTLQRPGGVSFPLEGGLSGAPLRPLAEKCLADVLRILGPRRKGKLLVSAGGVMSNEDVAIRLNMGADLVQVYSALIFKGPFFFRQIAGAMAAK